MKFLAVKKLPLWVKHLFVWLIYCAFNYGVYSITNPNITFSKVVFTNIPFCLAFYMIIYCLGLNLNKKILWAIATFFIVIIVMGAIGYAYMYIYMPMLGVKLYTTTDINYFYQEATFGYIKYFAFAALYFYIRQYLKKEKQIYLLEEEKLQLEKQKILNELENAILKQQELKAQQEKLQYEYAFLRAQINPHFLHNTLNVLFSQALNVSPELADNILKLSSIMRYSLENLEQINGKVPVEKEMEQLRTLIEINNLRFGNTKTVLYEVEGQLGNQTVPPLSLITVVENAFKYGDLKDPLNPLQIKIVLKPNEVYFYCKNKKKANYVQFSSLNIGITNLSKRLDVAFKDKYIMSAKNENDFYIFELTVKN
jgi:sensor histidine kinase YesM